MDLAILHRGLDILEKLKILIIEDEPAISRGLTDVLIFNGYDVSCEEDGKLGYERFTKEEFDLVLLDIMLPTMDGYTICNEIRKSDASTPIMMLTAKSSEEDIINGLSLGADDYIAKPFSVRVLVLRIESLLRRSRKSEKLAKEIKLGTYMLIDTENMIGSFQEKKSQTIEFSSREIALLLFLSANAGSPFNREDLLVSVWGYSKQSRIETRTVDIHVAKLRRKIEPDPKNPKFLITVRGKGYRLDHG